MNPQADFDRALRDAMRVEPSGDFTARIRTRLAAPPQSRVLVPRFALVAIACALLAVVAASVWRPTAPVAAAPLPHRGLMVLSAPPHVLPALPDQPLRHLRPTTSATNIVVSHSEMLALQQLFSGMTVAPPVPEPIAAELLIPELTIKPIAPFPAGPEGERQ